MPKFWSRDHLIRRVDRYYLLAAGARMPGLRKHYLSYARYYRKLLARAGSPGQWTVKPA